MSDPAKIKYSLIPTISETNSAGDDIENLPQNLSFLTDIHEILSRLEVGEDNDSLTLKITELSKKFDQGRQEIKSAVGINSTKERQETILKSMQQQLQIKKNILEKYKNLKLSNMPS